MAEQITVTDFIAKRIEVKEQQLAALTERIATLKQATYTTAVGKELDALVNHKTSITTQIESFKSI